MRLTMLGSGPGYHTSQQAWWWSQARQGIMVNNNSMINIIVSNTSMINIMVNNFMISTMSSQSRKPSPRNITPW